MVRFHGYQDDPEHGGLDVAYLRRLWPFVRPYRRAFALALLILLVSFGLEVLGPWLLRIALDGPVSDAIAGRTPDRGVVVGLGLAYVGVTAAAVGLGYGYAMLTVRNGQRVIRDVRTHLFGHLLRLGPRFYDDNPAGKLVTRVTTDVENLNELISTGVLQSLFDLLKIFGLLAVLFLLDVELALLATLATPVVIAISVLFRAHVRRSYRRVRSQLARQNAFTAEAVGGIEVTRLFGQERAVAEHYAEVNRSTRQAWLDTVLHFSLFVAMVDLALRVAQAAILWRGGTGILAGTISAGTFVQFWLYFAKLTEPIRELGEKYNVLQSAFSSSERLFQILDRAPVPAEPAHPRPAGRGPVHLQLEHVGFAYRPGKPVLHDVSFEVRPGQTVALVGPTGAGKTTILSLVSRLADPSEGRVLLDGVALPELDLYALRQRIATVPQDVFLFTGTVLDNVRLFDDSVPPQRVLDALEHVGARKMVEHLDGGLHAPVQERGATLSQGERQLLSFARALVTDPDILVLDEATASIDSAAEAQIQAGLRRLMRGRTSLIVAHRLSTVRDADLILVLSSGRIVERGRHDQLMQCNGVYARMVARS